MTNQPPTPNSQPLIDTVAAIATPIGPGGIGMIRVSGPEAFDFASRFFKNHSGKSVVDFPSHTVHLGLVVHPETREPIDQALLSVFRAPKSYTGEDTVEISCHGGMVTLRRVLEAVFAAGVRPAEPGEFTKRAFLNGRLDLAQAEAVNDLIRARTDDAQRIALRQLGGALSSQVRSVTDSILSMLARIEAAIDFPEDVPEPDPCTITKDIEEMVSVLDKLIETAGRGRIYREGISLAIVGRPNVGKSSLLNALLRQTRAIVTPIPGTTRDVIEETIIIHGMPVVAADTAGIRPSMDEVEQIGVELTEQTMAAANMALVVVDCSVGITDEDREILDRARSAMIVLNKIDLIAKNEMKETINRISAEFPGHIVTEVSASSGDGIELLEDRIAEAMLGTAHCSTEAVFVTSLRHKRTLITARESLSKALDTINKSMPIDLMSVDLVAARTSLGEITGDTASEDLIDRIFEDFCIGK
jgi:tRNA modification GTPase